MPVSVNPQARIAGLQAIELENDWLRVTVLPDLGAKIYDLVWKPTGTNFLWHNPRIPPQTCPIEANIDNYYCGGWDDGFPTCDACEFRGEQYPNLGELRSVRWTVEAAEREKGNAVTKLSAFGPISPVRAEKTITLAVGSPVVRVSYEITNLGPLPVDFIWGTHPALAPAVDMVLRIPAKTGIVGQTSHASLGTPNQRYAWPNLETSRGLTDMSRVQGIESGISCGHYATDLEAGWYAAEDLSAGTGFLLNFPRDVLPYLYMWLSYGGWRGYHVVVVEPWTSYPNTLSEAFRQGASRRLEAGANFSVEVRATIYAKPETWRDALERLNTEKV